MQSDLEMTTQLCNEKTYRNLIQKY